MISKTCCRLIQPHIQLRHPFFHCREGIHTEQSGSEVNDPIPPLASRFANSASFSSGLRLISCFPVAEGEDCMILGLGGGASWKMQR